MLYGSSVSMDKGFLVFLGSVKNTISVDNNKENSHLRYFIISLLGMFYAQTQVGMNTTPSLQSYFVVFNKNVFTKHFAA